MPALWRKLLCIVVGVICGWFGGFLVAVFWPVLFPLYLQGSSPGEDAVAIGFVVCSARIAYLP